MLLIILLIESNIIFYFKFDIFPLKLSPTSQDADDGMQAMNNKGRCASHADLKLIALISLILRAEFHLPHPTSCFQQDFKRPCLRRMFKRFQGLA